MKVVVPWYESSAIAWMLYYDIVCVSVGETRNKGQILDKRFAEFSY